MKMNPPSRARKSDIDKLVSKSRFGFDDCFQNPFKINQTVNPLSIQVMSLIFLIEAFQNSSNNFFLSTFYIFTQTHQTAPQIAFRKRLGIRSPIFLSANSSTALFA
jgi:hypothetical protein